MGTSGLLGFIHKGEKLCTYTPSGGHIPDLGAGIAAFIVSLTEDERRLMIERIGKIEWVDSGGPAPDIQQRYQDFHFHLLYPPGHWRYRKLSKYDEECINRSLVTWFEVLRGVWGSRSLQPILQGKLHHLMIAEEGLYDYEYWVDFENQTFEASRGSHRYGKWDFEGMRRPESFWYNLVGVERENEEYLRIEEPRFIAGLDNPHERPPSQFIEPWACEDAPAATPESSHGDEEISGSSEVDEEGGIARVRTSDVGGIREWAEAIEEAGVSLHPVENDTKVA